MIILSSKIFYFYLLKNSGICEDFVSVLIGCVNFNFLVMDKVNVFLVSPDFNTITMLTMLNKFCFS